MSVRIFFSLLIFLIFSSIGGFALIHHWQETKHVPQSPCYSVIKEGQFIGNDLQPYTFNGIITWWPKREQVSMFGIKRSGKDELVVKQTVQLTDVTQYGNAIYGRVGLIDNNSQASLSSTLNRKGAPISIIFKPVSEQRWLMMMNDNWISLCEKK
ncbi:hypothetical protein [Pantoea sp. y20]